MSGRRTMIIGLTAVALLVAACGGSSLPGSSTTAPGTTEATTVEFPLTIEDATGASFTFDEPVTAVGCWWIGCTEMMADMGLVPRAASSSKDEFTSPFFFPDGPPEYELADDAGPEEWGRTGVEVIFIDGPGNKDTTALEAVAPVFKLHYPPYTTSMSGLEAWRDNYRILGQITGQPELAEAALARYDGFVAQLQALAPESVADTSVLSLFSTSDGTYVALSPHDLLCLSLVDADSGRASTCRSTSRPRR